MSDIVLKAKTARGKIFYGWWLVLFGDVIGAITGGVWHYGFGTFINPITAETGWSRAAISVGMSFSQLQSGIEAPISGYLVDRFGPKKVVLAGLTAMSLGFLLLSRMNSLPTFYFACYTIAVGVGFSGGLPMFTMVANWFNRKIGKAMGLSQAAYGLSGLFAPLLVWLIARFGFRTTFLIIPAVLVIVCMPAAFALRHRPEQYGLLPDGEAPQDSESDKAALIKPRAAADSSKEFTVWAALKSKSFWFITSGCGLAFFGSSQIIVHEVPYLVSIGFTAEQGALGMLLITTSSLFGRMGLGWLGDVFKKKYIMIVCFTLMIAGVFILANAHTLWQAYLGLIVFGPGFGGQMPLRTALQREFFGRKAFGVTQGIMSSVTAVPNMLGGIFAGYVFDITGGNYRPAFLTGIFVWLVAIAIFVFIKPPALQPYPETKLQSR